jgi:hypothetical protein
VQEDDQRQRSVRRVTRQVHERGAGALPRHVDGHLVRLAGLQTAGVRGVGLGQSGMSFRGIGVREGDDQGARGAHADRARGGEAQAMHGRGG